jgi:hypothetical protein
MLLATNSNKALQSELQLATMKIASLQDTIQTLLASSATPSTNNNNFVTIEQVCNQGLRTVAYCICGRNHVLLHHRRLSKQG